MQWTYMTALASGLLAGIALALLGMRVGYKRRFFPQSWCTNLDRFLSRNFQPHSAVEHVIDSAEIGLYFWNIKTGTLRWTEHHYTIFGWPMGLPITYEMFRERVHPEDVHAVELAIEVAVRERSDYRMRYRICLPGGLVRYVRGSGRCTYDQQGKAIEMNGAVVDVTQSAEAENAVRQHQAELATIAENLPDIISRVDAKGRYLFVSPRIEELTGNPASFFLGKSHRDLGGDPLFAMRWHVMLESVVREKCVRESEFNVIDQHGQERFFITRAVPSLDRAGNVETVLTISTDHTERERAAELTRAIGDSLRKADERKNQYLATLAHELRGPLAPISSAIQLMKLSAQRPTRDKAREVIERQVANLSDLVNDLMEVGRISAGKMEINKARIPLQSVIDQSIESTRPLLDAKLQPLLVMPADEQIWIDGDMLRLTQVFSNLLTNASKYSPASTPISISSRIQGTNAQIKVRDQGIGLAKSSMDEVFDLFVQVHATGVQAQGGLGIGLSLVKQLVQIHQGQVTVTSDGPGKGSCFTVLLPIASEQLNSDAVAPADAPAIPALTVLVVDDNVDGATTLASLLDVMGHQAVVAFNGKDAVQVAAERDLDMAFIDLGLPDISGIQVALTIRGTAKGRSLPLIALTGLGRDEDRFLTKAAQFDEHIVKPLQVNELNRILNYVAGKRTPTNACDA